MRLIPMFTFAVPLALLLPLSAQAAWPAGAKASYMEDCTIAASKSVTPEVANKHCACGADVLEKKFTTEEIKQLMDKIKRPTPELETRALKEISACRVQK